VAVCGARARRRATRLRSRRSVTTATATPPAPVGRPAPPHGVARALRRGSGGASQARGDAAGAPTWRLLDGGPGAVAQKLGEEGVEAALAVASESDERVVSELADLWFASYVALAARGLDPATVEDELRVSPRPTPASRERRPHGRDVRGVEKPSARRRASPVHGRAGSRPPGRVARSRVAVPSVRRRRQAARLRLRAVVSQHMASCAADHDRLPGEPASTSSRSCRRTSRAGA
jgi:phosphoribosyl-ATP pyrophosphohydrolase